MLGKVIVATRFEKLPKFNKSPNLVTLGTAYSEHSVNQPLSHKFE